MTDNADPGSRERAGRWARLASAAIDMVALYWLLRGSEAILLGLGIYVPFEATYLIALVTGTMLLLGATGTTPGRWLCGIAVRTQSGGTVGIGRRMLREFVAKPLAVAPLLAYFYVRIVFREAHPWLRWPGRVLLVLGVAFLVIHIAMGLHDRIAGTMVVRAPQRRWRLAAIALGLSLPVLLIGGWAASNMLYYLDVRTVVPDVLPAVRFAGRDTTLVTDVATIGSARDGEFVAWLDSNAMPPAEFAIAKCRQYPLVLFGEGHGNHEILSFVAEALPRLYSEAGVHCLGMESINAEDNEALDQLMAGETFDEALAVDIYRNQSWRGWGGRGYVDILQAAWQINRDRGHTEPPFRVVGLDEPVDMPSMALAGGGGDRAAASFVERLRFGRVARDLPRLLLRDVTMARQAARQMLERGERGIVLVGANHASIGALAPYLGVHGEPRMGFILASTYPGDVYQINLTSHGLGKLGELLGRVMAPVGFEVRDSPFDLLRASDGSAFRGSPAAAFGDLAAAYVFLTRNASITPWVIGFVTPEMYVRYRPLYESKHGGMFEAEFGRPLGGPADIDSLLSRAGR